jgi:hypothetical protein
VAREANRDRSPPASRRHPPRGTVAVTAAATEAWVRRSAGSRTDATLTYFLAVADGTVITAVFTAEDARRYAEGLLELTGDRIG